GDVTGRVMIWKGFGDQTFAGVNGRLKKEDEKPGVIGNPLYLFMHVAGKGGVLEVWQLDTDKRFLPRIRTRLLRVGSVKENINQVTVSRDDHWHLVWEELIYIGLRLFAVNVSDMKAEYFPPKEDVILQNKAPADFYVLVTGAVELVVTRNEVEHANVGDGTVIMNNLLQELMETENILARCRLDLPLSLCFATLRGDDLLRHKLLKQGLDANESDNNGRTALHIAASKGNTNCVLLLLDFVADPNSR
nr:potassium channel AKT1-like [Tanacetum cinerariifolium]